MSINEYIEIMEETQDLCISGRYPNTACNLRIWLPPSELGLHHHLNAINGTNHFTSSLRFVGVLWRQEVSKESVEERI